MPTHVALLRGINVGGRNLVAMTALRDVVAGLGHAEVSTYIQSGNVLFATERTDTGALGEELEQAIAAQLGVRPGVVVLVREELAQLIAANPYTAETDPRRVHALVARERLTEGAVAAVAAAEQRARERGGGDSARVVGRAVFLHTPAGLGRSELAAQLGRSKPAQTSTATARNWATVTRLMALLDG